MKRFITLALCLFVSVATYAQTQVIAHRGYHATKNSYDNTISSLINAQKLKVYGSEVDIHETSDGVLIAIHGMRHRDIKNVQKATFDEIRSLPLENGETVVEDTKGYKTPDYIIKRKLMLQVHGIRIREV